MPEPEAAARFLAEARGERPDPGAPLVVCAIGAGSCNVGVARHEGERYRIESAKSAEDIGGKAFDGLLLDHLAPATARPIPNTGSAPPIPRRPRCVPRCSRRSEGPESI